MTYRRLGLSASVVVTAIAAVVIQSTAGIADINPQADGRMNNVLNAPLPDSSAQFGSAPKLKPGVPFCTGTGPGTTATNVNTDCKQSSVGPHNETSIAIDPNDPNHMIGGANDYQIVLNPAGQVAENILSQAHVTIDGGATWTDFPVFTDATYQATGDPSVAFDDVGNAYYATLGFRFVGPGNAQNPDVLVSHSTDGGKSWDVVRVAAGSGVATSVGDLLDKEYIVAWGKGNVMVTYGDFRLGQNTVTADTYDQVSHDGGNTWSTRVLLSRNLNDQSFVATPVIAADGSIYVSFLNTTDTTTGRDDYEVDKVSPLTGAVISGPVKVATTIDGFTDAPIAFGRQTYQDSAFRSWAAGNIAADPTNPTHLAVVWSDWTHTTPPSAPTDFSPYDWKTDADVRFSESTNGGATWSAPTDIARAGDQFQPWSAFDKNGNLRIGFFDRSYDSANHMYGYTVATVTSSAITFQQVTDQLSDPTQGDRWFSRTTLNKSFPHPTAFLGDYSNIAVTTAGHVVAYWTDMRNTVDFGGRSGFGEDAFFGTAS
jgi:hypothetical protein